ncbi:hypothetical protein FRC11_006044 [Ceratobasidium sp. 423]|nr:hypothetical protein FRC11_006044 [Ceratobasidium sp. 423]
MGLRTPTITSSSLEDTVWQQPGDDASDTGGINTGGSPNNHTQVGTEVALLTTTNLANSQASPPVPAGSRAENTMTTEEDINYDMCVECMDTQDDEYILVALEPASTSQQALSKT